MNDLVTILENGVLVKQNCKTAVGSGGIGSPSCTRNLEGHRQVANHSSLRQIVRAWQFLPIDFRHRTRNKNSRRGERSNTYLCVISGDVLIPLWELLPSRKKGM
jgi:hypothetical protein